MNGDELPFVAHPVGDLSVAAEVAARAAAQWHLPAPHLVRAGMNALYEAGDVMLRVGRTTVDPRAARSLQVVLEDHGIAVARQIDSLPAGVEGLSVIAQQRLRGEGEVDWREVGDIVRRVHGIDASEVRGTVPVPSCTAFPHWRLAEVLDDVAGDTTLALTAAEVEALRAALQRVEPWRSIVESGSVPTVLCHGDVHPGNVMATTDGTVLLDWDLLCTGPAAWDHSALLTWESRWGGTPGMYAAFAAGYRRDLRTDALAAMIAEGRLLAATLMRLRAARIDAATLDEARRRLRYWLGEPDAPVWRAV